MITNSVFVVDKNGTRLQPTNPGKARILQRDGNAKQIRLYPYVIMLQHEINTPVKQEAITFIHRNDGYAYRVTPINTELLQNSAI